MFLVDWSYFLPVIFTFFINVDFKNFVRQNFFPKIRGKTKSLKREVKSLGGVAQCIECRLMHQEVTGLIPGQDTFPGCGLHP